MRESLSRSSTSPRLPATAPRPRPSEPPSTAPAASRGSSTSSATASTPPSLRRLDRLSREFFALAARREDGDPHGARRPRLARLLPGRRRAHLGQARSEGRALLRRRARRRRIPRCGRARRSTAATSSRDARPSCAPAVLDHLAAMTAARPPPDGRHRARARPRARASSPIATPAIRCPLSHLPLPAAAGRRGSRDASGASASTPTTGSSPS